MNKNAVQVWSESSRLVGCVVTPITPLGYCEAGLDTEVKIS